MNLRASGDISQLSVDRQPSKKSHIRWVLFKTKCLKFLKRALSEPSLPLLVNLSTEVAGPESHLE